MCPMCGLDHLVNYFELFGGEEAYTKWKSGDNFFGYSTYQQYVDHLRKRLFLL